MNRDRLHRGVLKYDAAYDAAFHALGKALQANSASGSWSGYLTHALIMGLWQRPT